MPSSASASAPEPPAVAESSSRWRGCRLKADWGWSLPWGRSLPYRLQTPPPVSLCSTAPASGGVWSSGAKNEKGRSRWNGIGLRGADGNRIHRRVANGYIRFVSSVFLNVYLFVSPKVDVALYVVARGICQMSSSVIHGKNVVYQCCSLIGFSVLGHNPPEVLLNVEPHCDA